MQVSRVALLHRVHCLFTQHYLLRLLSSVSLTLRHQHIRVDHRVIVILEGHHTPLEGHRAFVTDRTLLQEVSCLHSCLALEVLRARVLVNSDLLVVELGGSVPCQGFEIWVPWAFGSNVALLLAAVTLLNLGVWDSHQVQIVLLFMVHNVFGKFTTESVL